MSTEWDAWIRQSGFDLEQASVSMDNSAYEWACYAAQQSAEKSLKAVLLAAGVEPKFTHHLHILANELGDAGIDRQGLPGPKDLVDLSDKNILARYPLDGDVAPHDRFTPEHAEQSIRTATAVKLFADRLLQEIRDERKKDKDGEGT